MQTRVTIYTSPAKKEKHKTCLTHLKNRIFQLTWGSDKGVINKVSDVKSFKKLFVPGFSHVMYVTFITDSPDSISFILVLCLSVRR